MCEYFLSQLVFILSYLNVCAPVEQPCPLLIWRSLCVCHKSHHQCHRCGVDLCSTRRSLCTCVTYHVRRYAHGSQVESERKGQESRFRSENRKSLTLEIFPCRNHHFRTLHRIHLRPLRTITSRLHRVYTISNVRIRTHISCHNNLQTTLKPSDTIGTSWVYKANDQRWA